MKRTKPVDVLSAFLLLSLNAIAQSTICLVKGDSIVAGSTDKSRINSVKQFNFIYDGPLDTMVVNGMRFLADVAPNFKTLADSSISAMRTLQTDYFSQMIQKEPAYFDKEIMRGYTSVGTGQLCLFGFENNKPVLLSIHFYMNKGVKHPVVISSSKLEQPEVLFLDRPLRAKGIIGNIDRGGAIIEVKRSISNLSNWGDRPIDVLILTKGRKQWMRK